MSSTGCGGGREREGYGSERAERGVEASSRASGSWTALWGEAEAEGVSPWSEACACCSAGRSGRCESREKPGGVAVSRSTEERVGSGGGTSWGWVGGKRGLTLAAVTVLEGAMGSGTTLNALRRADK